MKQKLLPINSAESRCQLSAYPALLHLWSSPASSSTPPTNVSFLWCDQSSRFCCCISFCTACTRGRCPVQWLRASCHRSGSAPSPPLLDGPSYVVKRSSEPCCCSVLHQWWLSTRILAGAELRNLRQVLPPFEMHIEALLVFRTDLAERAAPVLAFRLSEFGATGFWDCCSNLPLGTSDIALWWWCLWKQ